MIRRSSSVRRKQETLVMVGQEEPYTREETSVAELSTKGNNNQEIAIILKLSIPRVRAIKDTIIAKARSNLRGC